ncbi:hypothetical protein AOG2_00470 [Geobacter sp. AOG2]|nr:hypothetical protein AOG2_00470 [Geobacter sp. AOG2]
MGKIICPEMMTAHLSPCATNESATARMLDPRLA